MNNEELFDANDKLASEIKQLIEQSRYQVAVAVNSAMSFLQLPVIYLHLLYQIAKGNTLPLFEGWT